MRRSSRFAPRLAATAVGVALLVLAPLAGPATADPGTEAGSGAKVVGGRVSTSGEHPGQAALVFERARSVYDGQFCGGTVVAPTWILTAAHCLTEIPVTDLAVLTGSSDLRSRAGELIEAVEIRLDRRYQDCDLNVDGCRADHDVALVRLARPTTAPAVEFATPASPPAPDSVLSVVGWGATRHDSGGTSFPSDLQVVEVPSLPDADCQREIGPLYRPRTMVCAGAPATPSVGARAACVGDSGGPLFATEPGRRRVQVGVVSFGFEFCGEGPDVYTDVAAHADFVTTVLAGAARFPDVADSAHLGGILTVAELGVTTGYPDGTFRPGDAVTRGQMATFLARLLELEPGASVPPDSLRSVHEAGIASVVAAGISTGFPDGSFRPEAPLTRGQLATFLGRALALPGVSGPEFSDLEGNLHASAIREVAGAGIATGFPDGTFRPDAPVSRGQMATFLSRSIAYRPS